MHQLGGPVREAERTNEQSQAIALTLFAWAVGLVVNAAILGTPYLVFGYHSPALHLVLDSVDACIAFLVAYLIYGRFLRTRRLQDLLLAEGFFLLGLTGLLLSLAVPHLPDLQPRTVEVWLPLALRSTGALLIVAGAAAGDRRIRQPVRHWPLLAPWALLAVVALAMWWAHDLVPEAISPSPPASAMRPVIDGHPLVLVAQSLGAVCFLAASALFARQAGRSDDELLLWLGPACALGGFARVSYVLFPSLYSDWLYTGDVLRTLSYVLLLLGATREIRRYWSAHARAAVLDDRRRLARELHDGVVQELSYIRAEAHGLPYEDGLRERILTASERGLDEARAAVDALGRSPDEPLGYVLHRAARQVADRYGARVVVELDDAVDADEAQRHALVRITREAVSNAIRHGRADSVRIRLARDSGTRRLVVGDDGRGFDDETAAGGTGYGLTSMRERATALPGRFTLTSSPGGGTTVEVTW